MIFFTRRTQGNKVRYDCENYMNNQKDKIPLFKSWTHWYVAVISVLILLIILFYWLTKTFA